VQKALVFFASIFVLSPKTTFVATPMRDISGKIGFARRMFNVPNFINDGNELFSTPDCHEAPIKSKLEGINQVFSFAGDLVGLVKMGDEMKLYSLGQGSMLTSVGGTIIEAAGAVTDMAVCLRECSEKSGDLTRLNNPDGIDDAQTIKRRYETQRKYDVAFRGALKDAMDLSTMALEVTALIWASQVIAIATAAMATVTACAGVAKLWAGTREIPQATLATGETPLNPSRTREMKDLHVEDLN
jgi:hypothetical protein